MRISIDMVIYGYVFACVVLMLYNFIYILQSSVQNRNQPKHTEMWRKEILEQMHRICEGKEISPRYLHSLPKRLNSINVLGIYIRALETINKEQPEESREYLRAISSTLQNLAFKYVRKDSMARAFFADIIRRFPPCDNNGAYHPMMDILISYLNNSSVYCRENVLNALYTLGNIQAVENALEIFDNQKWFHHQKLISDGLTAFAGDKEELAARLWSKYKKWDDYLMQAVVQFITNCSPNYCQVFLPVLLDNSTDIEMRLAIMRYYRRYAYEPALPILLRFLNSGEYENDSMAIVAASALDRYKCEDTVQALKRALSHPNWHVRHNAAAALVSFQLPEARLQDILYGDDRYASEILEYMIERKAAFV